LARRRGWFSYALKLPADRDVDLALRFTGAMSGDDSTSWSTARLTAISLDGADVDTFVSRRSRCRRPRPNEPSP
jgi:hypothetical protein